MQPNQFDFSGRRAIITGGARGIGFGVAKRLQSGGAKVTLWDSDGDTLKRAAGALTGGDGDDAVAVARVDVADYAQVEAAAGEAERRFGGIDILVNAAGVAGANASVEAYPIDEWRRVIRVNLDGIFHACRAVVPVMRRADYGRIANIASIAGKEGNPNASAYSASKAAVIALTKSLGKELASTGIRVNALAPAVIDTEMLADVTQEHLAYMLSKIPMARAGQVTEAAAMVAWMCSAECSYTTAAVFDLSGGRATY